MEPRLLAKYGEAKLARYFVKSLEDLLDVVETVHKHLGQQVDGIDLMDVLRGVECSAVPIPRTLSSHILCFTVPRKTLESDNRPSHLAGRPQELKIGSAAYPRIVHESSRTLLVKEICSLYDLVVFQRFFKTLMTQNSDGIKMFTTKRSAEIKTAKLAEEKSGYLLTVSFPGVFFKGQVQITL